MWLREKRTKLLVIVIGILFLGVLYLGFELTSGSGFLAFAAGDPTKCGPAPQNYETIEGFARDTQGRLLFIARAVAGSGEGVSVPGAERLVFPTCTSTEPSLEPVMNLSVEMLDPQTLQPTGVTYHIVVGLIGGRFDPFEGTNQTK